MTKASPEPSSRASREAEIRAACDAGRHERALQVLLETYGAELLSFLCVRLQGWDRADEAFSWLAEDLWRGLPKFEFRSSTRTWAYALARHAAARYARSPERRPERHLALGEHPALSALVVKTRTETQPYRRTEVKDRIRALRDELDPDDRTLLVLRVDRGMSFRDLALVMGCEGQGGDAPEAGGAADEEQLARAAAKLRKRFERVKSELKRLAQREGLWP